MPPALLLGMFLASSSLMTSSRAFALTARCALALASSASFASASAGTCDAQQHSLLHSSYKVKGRRRYMEDECITSADGKLGAVFDGHGGGDVSKYLFERFLPTFEKLLPASKELQDQAVADTFVAALKQVDDEVLKKSKQMRSQGSTACLAYVNINDEKTGAGHVITANLGDSRAVLARQNKAIALTKDHKPNDPEEYSRILSVGGYVQVYGVPRVNGNLALSRAIGDEYERPAMSSVPAVTIHKLQSTKDEFIIIGTDGLWDVFTPEEAVEFVHKTLNGSIGALGDDDVATARLTDVKINEWAAQHSEDRQMLRAVMLSRKQNMAKYLTERALERGSSDNISVVVLWLK